MLPWSDWVVPSPYGTDAMGTKVKRHHFTARSTTRTMLNTARKGDKAKPSGVGAPTALLFVQAINTRSLRSNSWPA